MEREIWKRILLEADGVDAGATVEDPQVEFEDAEQESLEIIFTPDGNLPPSGDPLPAAAPDLTAQIAAEMAKIQAQTQQSPQAQPKESDLTKLVELLSKQQGQGQQQPGQQPDPRAAFRKFLQENEDGVIRNTTETLEKIFDQYGNTIVAPALRTLQAENQQLRASLNKQTVTQSETSKQIMADYGSEVEAKAKEYLAQGNPNPYEAAVRDVGFAHMAEITQKQVAAAIEASTKQAQAPPAANTNPQAPPVGQQRKKTVALSPAEKQAADNKGLSYEDYARYYKGV